MDDGRASLDQLTSRCRYRGLALIETAIVLPLILLLTLALIEYSWMFLKHQQITNAARQGARVGARVDATQADIQNALSASLTTAGMGDITPTITITPADLSTLSPGDMLSVTLQINYADIGLGMPLIPTPGALSSTTAMAREGEDTESEETP